MRFWHILSESLRLLASDPKLFIPRLVTTAFYTAVTLYSASLTAAMLNNSQPPQDLILGSLLLLSLMPALYVMDLFSYAMYPRLVEDRIKSGKTNIGKALAAALRSYKTVFVLAAAIFVFAVASSALVVPFFIYAMLSGSILLLIPPAILFFLAVMVFSIAVFFVIPSTVISGRGVAASFKESMSLGAKHKGELFMVNLVFGLLAVLTFYLVLQSELSDKADLVSMAFFVLVRAMQAVVYTYLCVVNPAAYLHVRT